MSVRGMQANAALAASAELANADPEGKAWFAKLKIADAGELKGLLDEKAYAQHCKDEKAKH